MNDVSSLCRAAQRYGADEIGRIISGQARDTKKNEGGPCRLPDAETVGLLGNRAQLQLVRRCIDETVFRVRLLRRRLHRIACRLGSLRSISCKTHHRKHAI